MNVWTFTGNLGRDADARYLPDGTSVVSFSAAVKSGYGDKAATTWPKCTIFGKRGESLQQYLIKGVQVAVAGEVSLREWQDKDGMDRYTTEISVGGIGGVLTAQRDVLQRDWHVIVQARKADRLVLPAGSVIVRTVEGL